MAPFMIFALPRSRTAWLSAFLTYGGWQCHHETAIRARSIEQMAWFLRLPRTGVAETACALGWRLFGYHVPELQRVVVRRPVDDVVASMMRADLRGVATYDEPTLRALMQRQRRALDELAVQPGVLVVDYAVLDRRDACAAVFEHCLPLKLPKDRWENMRQRNVQKDITSFILYYQRHKEAVDRFKAAAKAELWRLARAGLIGREAAVGHS